MLVFKNYFTFLYLLTWWLSLCCYKAEEPEPALYGWNVKTKDGKNLKDACGTLGKKLQLQNDTVYDAFKDSKNDCKDDSKTLNLLKCTYGNDTLQNIYDMGNSCTGDDVQYYDCNENCCNYDGEFQGILKDLWDGYVFQNWDVTLKDGKTLNDACEALANNLRISNQVKDAFVEPRSNCNDYFESADLLKCMYDDGSPKNTYYMGSSNCKKDIIYYDYQEGCSNSLGLRQGVLEGLIP